MITSDSRQWQVMATLRTSLQASSSSLCATANLEKNSALKITKKIKIIDGSTENAGSENGVPKKIKRWNDRPGKSGTDITEADTTGLQNARPNWQGWKNERFKMNVLNTIHKCCCMRLNFGMNRNK